MSVVPRLHVCLSEIITTYTENRVTHCTGMYASDVKILIYVFTAKEERITRGHYVTFAKEWKLGLRKF